MISIRNITVTIVLGTLSAWNTGCTVGLGVVDKSVDTAGGIFLDTGLADTGAPVDTNDTENTDTNDTDTGDTEDTQDTQPTSDVDGDGFAVEDGDCDDYDPLISPSASDECDGVDNNCDGQVDENAIGGIYEPNDLSGSGYYMGDLTSISYTEIQGLILEQTDVDIYEIYIYDEMSLLFENFSIDFELHAMGIQTDFVIELWWIEDIFGIRNEQLVLADNLGSGGLERGRVSGSIWTDETGYYEFKVYANDGYGCDAHYKLNIEVRQ